MFIKDLLKVEERCIQFRSVC